MIPGIFPTGAMGLACGLLLTVGVSAGLFDVPLEAYLQDRSPPEKRGSILAAANLVIFSGVLSASVLYYVLRLDQGDGPMFEAGQIFLLFGLLTIPVFLYIVWLLPQATVRFLVWICSLFVYRIRVIGQDNVPERGGASSCGARS